MSVAAHIKISAACKFSHPFKIIWLWFSLMQIKLFLLSNRSYNRMTMTDIKIHKRLSTVTDIINYSFKENDQKKRR